MSDFDWIVLSDGARVRVPKLPPQEDSATGVTDGPVGGSDKGFALLEKVRSAWGSTAGAGSDFFHVYRKQRAREMARQEELEKEWKETQEDEAFQARRLANFLADKEKAARKREKRKRKKEKQKASKHMKRSLPREEALIVEESGERTSPRSPIAHDKPVQESKSSPQALSTQPANVEPMSASPPKVESKVKINDDEDVF
eukprot:Blabericola_migrator_1__1873@NODE_150_length_12827_cov_208_685893_g131_i0_p6_GENE_NODE_150_length_12827_cov_208_685893_g131_i0NODE_150_length_12827_cov_208_685893_g131_i0_p6_ORF_typecomplete_len200_score36_93DUF1168/PF06658_12/9_8e28Rrn6/PF10214_9/0_00095ZapA/PF05164_13/0_011DUF3381/PF11861_8/0_23PET117/PF15786_5/1_7PET117/PF15786_5/1_9e02IncFII_repA/PF02387_15/0_33DDRGK/PF09756_9/5_9AspBHydro_N/PF05279_11/8_8LCD1/PF09798_9/8_4DUF3484/PF11983_8/2e02DUF3484/PF11983_8/2_3_NODE_150_length_12827_cov